MCFEALIFGLNGGLREEGLPWLRGISRLFYKFLFKGNPGRFHSQRQGSRSWKQEYSEMQMPLKGHSADAWKVSKVFSRIERQGRLRPPFRRRKSTPLSSLIEYSRSGVLEMERRVG